MDDRKKIRKFGIGLAVVFLLFGLFSNRGFFLLAFFVSVIVIVNPLLLMPVYRFLMYVSHMIGWFNTRVLLCIIYYLVFTPIGMVTRLFRKDLLDRKFERAKATYWIPCNDEFNPTRCERQY